MGEKHWRKQQEESFNELNNKYNPKLKGLTPNQDRYLQVLEKSKVIVCTGPAGTGKTYMACGKAIEMLRANRIERIVLTRPLQECGEELGTLPGGLDEKAIDMMAPLLEALDEFLKPKELETLRLEKKIVIVPLAKMRGRTLKNSFVILDEAQNATFRQLKMFVTRFGSKAKMVICGDHEQSDLPYNGRNSLLDVSLRFKANLHPDVSVMEFTRDDIVRDELVRWFDEVLGSPMRTPSEEKECVCPNCRMKFAYELEQEEDIICCCHCRKSIEITDENGVFDPIVVDEAPSYYSRRA